MKLEPISQLDVLLHPPAPCIQHDHGQLQRLPAHQILLDEFLPCSRYFLGDFCESISGKIDEAITALDVEEIDQLRTARPGTCTSQPLGPHQHIYQAGFTDIATS